MRLAWRLALRDLRGGLGGLRLLAVCLFCGVAAIAGIGSLSAAIVAELASEGRTILGGDLEVSLTQRVATSAERAELERLGRVSESAKLSAMASRLDGSRTMLAGLKAVDARYPLAGRLTVVPGRAVPAPGAGDVLLAPALADRLGVWTGDRVRFGEAAFRVAGLIDGEPDKVGEGFGFGPTAIIGMVGLRATRLIQPGSLYRWRYRIALPPGTDAHALALRLAGAHGEAGWHVEDTSDAAPSVRQSIEQIGQFLTLVALSALVIAGVGVGNGVGAYLDRKRAGIATLKTLGASSALIARVYLIEIGVVAAGAILVALAAGAALPALVVALAGDALPVAPKPGVYPLPLLEAAIYGVLIALAFAVAPLARARAVGAAALFRGAVDERTRPGIGVIAVAALCLLSAAGLAIATAGTPIFAAAVLGAAAVLVALLAALGAGVRALAARLPRSRRPLLRLAIANLHAPAAQTDRLIVALGLGLSLFVTLAVVRTDLAGQLRDTVPARAPSFFLLDIPSDGLGAFRALVARVAPGGELVTVPSLRGPVVAINGVRVATMKDVPAGAWILKGDRGLTFASDLPAGNRITAGRWWPRDYAGPPLVSLDRAAGDALHLRVGDAITVSALGVEVPARIASFRRIDWQSMGFNFALIFSPHTFDGAPFNYMATLAVAKPREEAVSRAVTRAFPSVSLIAVRDVIAAVGALLGQLATAVAAASSVAIAAGIAVLVGAVLAARAARVYDAVVLKQLGATRAQVLAVQLLEYALLAGLVAVAALAVGGAAGWYVVTHVLALPWTPDWLAVVATLIVAVLVILAVGLLGSLPALAARPARALREL